MSTAVAKTSQNSPLVAMSERLAIDPNNLYSTLKATVFKNANDAEMAALCIVANQHGLNPLTKQIYAFPSKGGGITPVVSVDGWIAIMNGQKRFNGIDFDMKLDDSGKPVSCTAIIHIKDRDNPVKITEYFDEVKRNTEQWANMPKRMMRHKALIQGVRVAFGVSGLYDEDEANDMKAAKVISVETVKPADPFAALKEPAKEPDPVVVQVSEPEPVTTEPQQPEPAQAPPPPEPPKKTAKQRFIEIAETKGVPYDDFKTFLVNQGIFRDADSFPSYEDLPANVYEALTKAQVDKIVKTYGASK